MKKAKEQKTPEQEPEVKATESTEGTENQNTTEEAANQITADIESLNNEVLDLKDKNLRLMAEFDNFRRRSSKERLELVKTAAEDVLVRILPLLRMDSIPC